MLNIPELTLPENIRKRACLRGNEWAWPVDEIPAVIEAARLAGLVNIGGQLQFRFPDGTCELYWIEVNTFQTNASGLSWQERINQTATDALSQFQALQEQFDFLAEGQLSFSEHFDYYRANGSDPIDAICFVWYFEASAKDLQPRE